MPKHGDLKVWWIPQVPGKPFEVPVDTVEEAALLYNVLAEYDAFQFENRIKPDYCNAGGLVMWDEEVDPDDKGSHWVDYCDPDTGDEWDTVMAGVLLKRGIIRGDRDNMCYVIRRPVDNNKIEICLSSYGELPVNEMEAMCKAKPACEKYVVCSGEELRKYAEMGVILTVE